jgi:NADPH-dependent 2,4-dienoyl-CoA reductase/sulfur reductase-like enzyme
MFGIPYYNKPLDALRQSRNIPATFNANLVEVRADDRTAVFKPTTGDSSKLIEKSYDILHVVPPQGPWEFVSSSPLADGAGWVDVDKHTLQSNKFDNVFSLGDASSLPTSKTAAAITAEAPVLVHNLSSLMETGSVGKASYDG